MYYKNLIFFMDIYIDGWNQQVNVRTCFFLGLWLPYFNLYGKSFVNHSGANYSYNHLRFCKYKINVNSSYQLLCSFQAHIHLMLREGIFFRIGRYSRLWTSKLHYISQYYSSCWPDVSTPHLSHFQLESGATKKVFERLKII